MSGSASEPLSSVAGSNTVLVSTILAKNYQVYFAEKLQLYLLFLSCFLKVPLTKKTVAIMAVTAKIGKISASHLILMRLVTRLKQRIEKTFILYN